MREIKRILVPIDFSTSTMEIIPYAVAFAGKFGAKIYFRPRHSPYPNDRRHLYAAGLHINWTSGRSGL